MTRLNVYVPENLLQEWKKRTLSGLSVSRLLQEAMSKDIAALPPFPPPSDTEGSEETCPYAYCSQTFSSMSLLEDHIQATHDPR